MAGALSELSGNLPSDPDAQATVTDFLDYTEFFPSDLFRSLTLIGKLDDSYQQDAARIHELTKTYGALPKLHPQGRPDPHRLRQDISSHLDHAIRCRESTFVEATRLCNVADNLYTRLVSIKKKLEALPKPPSRDPTPVPRTRSPGVSRARKNDHERTPRITLFTESNRPAVSSRSGATTARPKHRNRKTVVPGEVLPPYDPNSPGGSVDTDSDSERPSSPVAPPIRLPDQPTQEKILKLPKATTIKLPKPAPRFRPPGVMGTNVHSAVAGISVSNAMAILAPPPANPQPGSKHAPWLKLTEWELNKLRKRMKKNADWVPSDTMVRRELSENGRGADNLNKARALARATGEEFLDEEPEAFIRPVTYRSQSTNLLLSPDAVEQLENRGMKLNQAKKLKRYTLLKEQAAREQADREEIETDPDDNETSIESISIKRNDTTSAEPPTKQQAAEVSRDAKSSKKRARESSSEPTAVSTNPTTSAVKEEIGRPAPKKLKLAPLAPMASSNDVVAPVGTGTATGSAIDPTAVFNGVGKAQMMTASKTTHSTQTPADSPLISTMKTPFPLDLKAPKTTTRSNRASAYSTKAPTPAPDSTSITEPAAPILHRSRGAAIISLTLANKKAASAEPPARRTSGRRPSDASLPSIQAGGPAVLRMAPPTTTRRGKRPAPGLLTSHNNGGLHVVLGKRKAAPGRKQSLTGKKSKVDAAALTAAEEEGSVDADDGPYCLCGGGSYGAMVECENDDCRGEWFHFKCVGLTDVDRPGRRTKWFCPECRVKLKCGEHGEPVERNAGRK